MTTALISRLLLVLVAALAISGCDSQSDPDGSTSPLLGRWELGSETRAIYVTLTQTQSVLDYLQPGEGDLAVSGAVSGDLRWLSQRWEGGGTTGRDTVLEVASAPLSDPSQGAIRLRVGSSGFGVVETDRATFYLPGANERPDLIMLSADRLVVMSARFRSPETGEEVVVSGQLTVPRQTLEAGREALVHKQARAYPDIAARLLEFGEDGRLTNTSASGSATGRWEVTGDGRLRLELPWGSTSYSYLLDGSTLRLNHEPAALPQIEIFLEGALGLQAGTLASTRAVLTEQFGRP